MKKSHRKPEKTVLTLPALIGLDGVWASIPVGELLAIIMSGYYFRKLNSKD